MANGRVSVSRGWRRVVGLGLFWAGGFLLGLGCGEGIGQVSRCWWGSPAPLKSRLGNSRVSVSNDFNLNLCRLTLTYIDLATIPYINHTCAR